MKKIYEEIPMIKNMYYDDNNTLLIKLDAPSTVLSQRRYQNMINEIINKYRE